jgi:hypothetical protein
MLNNDRGIFLFSLNERFSSRWEAAPNQGEGIIKSFKKKRKEPARKGWRGITDIQTELTLIPGSIGAKSIIW